MPLRGLFVFHRILFYNIFSPLYTEYRKERCPMDTVIRPELMPGNKYWIERHRYYELKHFCLQYPIWKKAYAALDGLSSRSGDLTMISKHSDIPDPTAKCAESALFYSERMEMVERAAKETSDSVLSDYILMGVTQGLSYDNLKTMHNIPCCKAVYYELYRRFFWILNKIRQ